MPLSTFVCAYCQIEAAAGKRKKSQVTFTRVQRRVQGRLHFCCQAHVFAYFRERRRRTVACRYCGATIQRKEHGVTFCDKTCYAAWKTGRSVSNPRVIDAEQRILVAWQAGCRGVRALARAAEASVNTVRKLIAAGKLVEPCAS